MKKRMKSFLIALAAVAAAAAELSAQPVVSQKLLNCQGFGTDGSRYETIVTITSQILPQGVQTSYELANVKIPTTGPSQTVAATAFGQPFAYATGGILNGGQTSVFLGEWGDDQAMHGTLKAMDFAPEAGVPVACRSSADEARQVAFPAFPVADRAHLANLLTALVVAHEGIPVNGDDAAPEDQSLNVLGSGDGMTCALSSQDVLACEASYLQGRWNGEAKARFAVRNGQVTHLIDANFGGSF